MVRVVELGLHESHFVAVGCGSVEVSQCVFEELHVAFDEVQVLGAEDEVLACLHGGFVLCVWWVWDFKGCVTIND